MTYPAIIVDENGDQTAGNTIEFTDPDNQPAGTNQPFKPASGDVVVIVENADGDTVYDYDDDSGKHEFTGDVSVAGSGGITVTDGGGVTAASFQATPADPGDTVFEGGGGTIDDFILGQTVSYVTDVAAPPTVFVTPLVFDHTAVTGGLYAWTGSAYLQVGGPLA